MSIEAMISEHPQVGANVNPSLARAVMHANECAAICNSCADACLAEPMDMDQCIRVCLDCSDVCALTTRTAMRRTGHDRNLIRSILAVCIEACTTCAEECERHDNPHCRRCAEMCRECEQSCRDALKVLNEEVHYAT